MRLLIFFGCLVAFWLVFYLLHIERQEFAMVAGGIGARKGWGWQRFRVDREGL